MMEPPPAIPKGDVGTPNLVGNVIAARDTPSLQPADAFEDTMDTDILPNNDAPLVETQDTSSETEVSHTTGNKDSVSAKPNHTATETERPSPPSPVPLNAIDETGAPAFLLRHGKGTREVNILKYLKKVEDPYFQQVLYHYLRFEVNNKSVTGGSLPTANRPLEISQWSSKARPETLPDYTKGRRTLANFVDSVFAWWGSIQPPWRSFERGKVSRDVLGGWDVLHAPRINVLHAPRINGLLNVVILVYWWIKALREHGLKDGGCADYEFFANDVAWVFSQLAD